jgi:UDP-N-acetylmuramoyl-tripeptide--D-alanyl-D-alanine ligase
MQWRVEDILKATGGRLACGPLTSLFSGVVIDSRTIASDQLFVAICGEHHDGHSFVSQVLDHGVKGVMIQSDHTIETQYRSWCAAGTTCIVVADTTLALGALAAFQRRQFAIPVVAITGSNGKTTTRRMTEQVLAQRFRTLATQGNFNNEIGLPLTLFKLTADHQAAVLELGMNHFGEMNRLGAICQPTIAVITNVAAAHLEYVGSLEGVARAKGELIRHIHASGTLVLNQDDPQVAALADQAQCRVLFYGTAADAAVRAENIRTDPAGIVFDLVLPIGQTRVALHTPGRFMVLNALAAACAGYLAGVDIDGIKQGLEGFQAVQGRLNLLQTDQGVHIIDDTYNANPGSMVVAFDTLTNLKQDAPAYIALGDMLELGNQASVLHSVVGEKAAAVGPLKLYAFGNYAQDVAAGAQRAGLPSERIFVGTQEAIAADLRKHLKSGDWLLVKGSRGMAMETVVAEVIGERGEKKQNDK